MILAGLGIVLMVAGIILVVVQTGQSWSRRRTPSDKPAADQAKPGISYAAVALLSAGALLVILATSGWL